MSTSASIVNPASIKKLEENEPPCDECLEHPVNLNSHRFIGKDGSMGLKTNEVYETRIFIKEKFLWVEWKVNLFSVKSCPYSSTKAFAQNWELASTI